MTRKLKTVTRRLWRLTLAVGLVLLLLLIIRIYEAERGPELHRWHIWIPHELTAEQLDTGGYSDYLNVVNHPFDEM